MDSIQPSSEQASELAVNSRVGMHSVAAGFGLFGVTVASSYLLTRTLYRSIRRTREDELRTLVDELAAQVAGTNE